MTIWKLRPHVVRTFVGSPELDMGISLGREIEGPSVFIVLSDIVALTFDAQTAEQAEIVQRRRWASQNVEEADRQNDFLDWLEGLETTGPIEPVPPEQARNLLPYIAYTGLPPQPPPHVYGHLPLVGASQSDDVYYRYEPFPSSKRIDQKKRSCSPGTFASPASELPFLPTGLSVVARCALPSVFPARWRWELQPDAGTVMHYGASVPLYGQSGGGVEVMFPKGFKNRGPIANPVVLPIL